MDVFEAISMRRSIGKVKAETPARDLVEQILEAGTWAPSHHRTEPWRFVVLTGNARNRLGDAMAEGLRAELPDPDSSDSRARLDSERFKPLRAPIIIAVVVSPSAKPRVKEGEEYAAVAMAAQNMLLAVHALGLGALLRTGEATHRKKVKEFFGLKGREHLFGFIYIGHPAGPPPIGSRTPFKEKTDWQE